MAKDMASDNNWMDLAPPLAPRAQPKAMITAQIGPTGRATCALFLNKFALEHLAGADTLGVQVGADGRLRVLAAGAFARPKMPGQGSARVVLPRLPGAPDHGKGRCTVEIAGDCLVLGKPLWVETEPKTRAKPKARAALPNPVQPARPNGSLDRVGEPESAWEARRVREQRILGVSWQSIARELNKDVADVRRAYDPGYRGA